MELAPAGAGVEIGEVLSVIPCMYKNLRGSSGHVSRVATHADSLTIGLRSQQT
jgi:hypothetical protein